jgi:replication factor A1
LLLADKSDVLRVVLWNHQTDLVESGKIVVGQVVRFSHGYTKEDQNGRVELHVGDKCEAEVNPAGVRSEDYPTISRFLTKIGEITRCHMNKRVNVSGTVRNLFPVSTFERQDLTSGKVLHFTLADATGAVSVVAWNGKANELEKTLKEGVELHVIHGKIKKALGEGLEIHVDNGAYAEVVALSEPFLKIADLKEGLNHVNLEAEVVAKPVLREVKTSKGEFVRLASIELKDETGRIWLVAWREHAEMVGNLKPTDRIVAKDVYAKKGFGEQIEVSTRDTSSITRAEQGRKD